MTARMGVSVGRLPQEVLLEEFYRTECSGTIQVGRVRVFQEFNCSVLTFWSAIKFHREYRTRVRYNTIKILRDQVVKLPSETTNAVSLHKA
jgi:hypothetical protein